jgi:hypothetical protein
MAERKRSTRTYSKRRSRAVWRPGRSEEDSEKGEEELEGGGEFGEGVEGNDEWLGEGGGKGVQHAGPELDSCADEKIELKGSRD